MTLLPIEQWQVNGVDGPKLTVGPWCAHPKCKRPADHAHHLWRRSFLGGDFSWVELPDGTIVGNLVALCVQHHDQVTGRLGGHEAAIRMTEDRVFWWCTAGHHEQGDPEWVYRWPLDPQPPAREASIPTPSDPESGRCPTCGRRATAKRSSSHSLPHGERRRRKNFNIPVPADAEEDGAEVMETLIEDLAVLLGVEPDANGRYYVVVPALYFAVQERERFRDTVLGKGE